MQGMNGGGGQIPPYRGDGIGQQMMHNNSSQGPWIVTDGSQQFVAPISQQHIAMGIGSFNNGQSQAEAMAIQQQQHQQQQQQPLPHQQTTARQVATNYGTIRKFVNPDRDITGLDREARLGNKVGVEKQVLEGEIKYSNNPTQIVGRKVITKRLAEREFSHEEMRNDFRNLDYMPISIRKLN